MAKSIIIPFPVFENMDLTGSIALQDAAITGILARAPALEIDMQGFGANQVGEVFLAHYGTRGFWANPGLSSGAALTQIFKYAYRLRANLSRSDTWENTTASSFVGIAHGSLGAQPWPSTGGPVAQLRVLATLNTLWDLQLVYGGGAGQTIVASTIAPAIFPANSGGLLELVIDYPNLKIEGWFNNKKYGELPMTGWSGSQLPRANPTGQNPWFSLFLAGGSHASARAWYHAFTACQMEIPLKSV